MADKSGRDDKDDDDEKQDEGNFKNGLFGDEKAVDERASNTDVRGGGSYNEDASNKRKKDKSRRREDHIEVAEHVAKVKKRAKKSVEPEPEPADVDAGNDTTGGDLTGGTTVTGAEDTTGTGGAAAVPVPVKPAELKKKPPAKTVAKHLAVSTPPQHSPAQSPHHPHKKDHHHHQRPVNDKYKELHALIAKERLDVDSLIRRVLMTAMPGQGLTKTVPIPEIQSLIRVAKFAFASAPALVEVEAPINICGDTHGQYGDLLRLFRKGGFPPTSNYLFLGDYVDRGSQNLEVIILLLCYRIMYPGNFVILRGNHECRQINRIYGFYEECHRRFKSQLLWNEFQDMFDMMPLAGLVSRRILCMHGGISPKIMNDRWRDLIRAIPRPCSPDEGQLAMDLLWSDPVAGNAGFLPNPRGASFGFGEPTVNEFCHTTGIDLIARGHQVVQDGYEFFCNRKLVTVFSAPFYCGQFTNCAAIMCVNEELQCSFVVMRGHAKLDAPEDPKMPVQDLDTVNPHIPDMTNEEMDGKATISDKPAG